MLQDAIKLLNEQADRFRAIIEKEPKNAKTQAQCWQLISENEDIVAKLKAFSFNNRDKGLKQRKTQTPSAKSVSRQQAIYNIIEANGGEMPIGDIESAVQLLEEHKGLSQPIIRYNVEILIDNGQIVSSSYGNYAIKKSLNDES